MRRVVLIVAVVAAATAGIIVAGAAADKPTAPPSVLDAAPAGQPPASLVGKKVHVYFRGSDDLSLLSPWDGEKRVYSKLTNLSGKVLQVHPGWIELEDKGRLGPATAWIPSTSVGYILVDKAGAEPATQP